MIAHTLGNPFDLYHVKSFCDKHGLWLIEDNCDALGSEYMMNGVNRKTGTIGDIGTRRTGFDPARTTEKFQSGEEIKQHLLYYD